MRVKRHRGKVYGAEFTAAERKGMHVEIQRQLAEYTRSHNREICACCLWVLHSEFGFGPKRLKRFYDAFEPQVIGLQERYEMGREDRLWLITRMLQEECGVDISEWLREEEE